VRVVAAAIGDVDSWLTLAEEVEHLFGPMVEESGFTQALLRNLGRCPPCAPGPTTGRPDRSWPVGSSSRRTSRGITSAGWPSVPLSAAAAWGRSWLGQQSGAS
jgi:hypothetical protein